MATPARLQPSQQLGGRLLRLLRLLRCRWTWRRAMIVLSVLTLQATGFALTAEQAAAGAIEAAAREGEALREKDEQLAAQAESIATQAETSQLSWRRLLR